jgi:phosphoglycerate dehydrogenase-like enzyme
MKVVFYGDMACRIAQSIPTFEGMEYQYLDDRTSMELVAQACENTDVLVSMVFDNRFQASNLKLLQVPGIGLDKVNFSLLPKETCVAICRGHENAVAEYVLATAIVMRRNLFGAANNFAAGSWYDSSRTGGPLQGDLGKDIVGVIGGGVIGRKVVEMFSCLNMTTLCCTRYPFPTLSKTIFFDRSQLLNMLKISDIVVVACALDDSSYHIIDDNALRTMRSSTILINVARGECVDDAALYKACVELQISGAVLDVWYNYPSAKELSPKPSCWPFESLSNVLMTPHLSAWTTGVVDRRAAVVAENLQRLMSGKPLIEQISNKENL